MTSPSDIRYHYADVPTLEEFALSNAFIRGAMGPLGCVSAETEFLTPAGWKRIDAFEPGDLVAQWTPWTKRIEFVQPTKYVALPCAELIEFDCGLSLKMRLSEEHRVPHYDWKGSFEVRTAAQIERKRSRRTIPTTFEGHTDDALGMSDDMIRFAVMMHADGHYPRRGTKASVTVRKERKKVRFRALLQRLGLEFAEIVYSGRPTETVFRFVAPYRGKRFTGRWWQASARELAIVLDEMRYWDGHDGECLIYFSSHKEDADFIQYAAHANGYRAAIHRTDSKEHPEWRSSWSVMVRRRDNAKNRACIREATVIRRVPTTDGKKYCFTVPSSFFVARYDNTVFITGNSGKSSACVIELVRRGLAQRPGPDGVRRTRFAVIRNTYGELAGTTIKTVMEWLPERYFGRYIEHKHTYTVTAFDGVEIEILFLALDRPEDIKKLLSLELTGAWVNEAREVPWAVIEALQGRVGRFPSARSGGCTWSGIWMDTNPPDSDSAWYAFFEEKKWRKDFDRLKREGLLPRDMPPEAYVGFFKQPSGLSEQAENLANLPGGRMYYARLLAGKSDEWIKIYVHGDYGFLMEGKLVYPEYNDGVHCRAVDPVPGIIIRRGLDFGLTPACAFGQELPTGQILIFDELVSDNMSVDEFADNLIGHCNRAFKGQADFYDVGDPAGNIRVETDKRTAFDMLRAKGIQIEPAMSQDPTLRQESVRKPLRTLVGGEPQFILHPRCKMLRKGFMGGYHRRRMKVGGPERYTDKPDKNQYSHCFPAGTLVTTPHGRRAIETLRVGDAVCTPLGARKITATMDRVTPETIHLTTASGRRLECTPDHPIWSTNGFVRADALQYASILTTDESWAGQQSIRCKNSTGSATTESRRAIIKADLATAIGTCIVMCGYFTTALSQRAMRFTTIQTVTGPTTTSATSSSWSAGRMRRSTAQSVPQPILPAWPSTWRISGPRPANGIGQRKGAPGIGFTPLKWLRAWSSKITPAFDAGVPIRLSAGLAKLAIAPRTARRLLGKSGAPMTNSGRAQYVERLSRSIATAGPKHADALVATSRCAEPRRVYDLTVADAHCFFANGILVSNCHDALQYLMVELFGPQLTATVHTDDDFYDRPDYAAEATRSPYTGY